MGIRRLALPAGAGEVRRPVTAEIAIAVDVEAGLSRLRYDGRGSVSPCLPAQADRRGGLPPRSSRDEPTFTIPYNHCSTYWA